MLNKVLLLGSAFSLQTFWMNLSVLWIFKTCLLIYAITRCVVVLCNVRTVAAVLHCLLFVHKLYLISGIILFRLSSVYSRLMNIQGPRRVYGCIIKHWNRTNDAWHMLLHQKRHKLETYLASFFFLISFM